LQKALSQNGYGVLYFVIVSPSSVYETNKFEEVVSQPAVGVVCVLPMLVRRAAPSGTRDLPICVGPSLTLDESLTDQVESRFTQWRLTLGESLMDQVESRSEPR